MLELEKNSSKSTSVDDTSHSFTPTSNVRNGFRRKKGDSPFTYNLNLKVKKEKKQSNCTNPDPWARIVGSRNTAAIYVVPTGMEETPKAALDIHCLQRGGGAALTQMINLIPPPRGDGGAWAIMA